MFQRRTTGSVVCPSCGSLVGVRDDKCYTCGRSNPGLWGFAPVLRQLGADLGFVPLVMGTCTALYLATLLASGSELQVAGGLSILAPSLRALFLFGASGAVPVFGAGRWWTIFSATWLHGGLLHIVFNMMWLRQLGTSTVDLIGPSRTIIIYTISGACGFVASSVAGVVLGGLPIPLLHGASFTVGASASICGLLGALLHYGRKGGSSLIRGEATRLAIFLIGFGLLMPGIDNYAHAGGFVGGYATSAVLNPFTRERGDHLIAAIACLAVSALAIAFSIIHGFALFR